MATLTGKRKGAATHTSRKMSKTREAPSKVLEPHFRPIHASFCTACVRDGSYHARTQYLMNWLSIWLRFQRRIRENGIAVFDIDDTLVDENERCIAPVCRVYKLCLTLGFHCALVTARPDTTHNRRETTKMLRQNRIDEWESLYMMPTNINPTAESVSKYKRSARDDISSRHDIIINVGDMWHDLIPIPVRGEFGPLKQLNHRDCGIVFPPNSHDEVAIKLIASVDYDDDAD